MIINHNMNAMNAHRMMGMNINGAGKSMEKLSSGLRINRAGDDAAGLAISEKMRGQIRGLDQASRNAQDGISLIQTAEGALNETHSILQRMRELSVQAANDTNNTADRGQIQKEINQLTSEINRIGNTTEFNTMKLLNGDHSDKSVASTVTVAKAKSYGDMSSAPKAAWDADAYKFNITSDGTANGVKFTGADPAGLDWTKLKNDAANTLKITADKTSGTFKIDGEFDDGTAKLTIDSEQMTLNAAGDTYTYDNHGISFQIKKDEFDKAVDGKGVTLDLVKGADAPVNVTTANVATKNDWTTNDADATKASTMTGFEITSSDQKPNGLASVNVKLDKDSKTLSVTLSDKDGKQLVKEDMVLDAVNNKTVNYDSNGVKFTFKTDDAAEDSEITINLEQENVSKLQDSSLTFQVGANEHQSMALSLSDMRSEALGISSAKGGEGFTADKVVTNGTDNAMAESSLDVSDATKAAKAVTTVQAAIDKVSDERSKLGAVQNRLEHTINNLGTSSENLQAAESRIRDVDMAKEMMTFSKNNILQQAAQAMLAQANNQPQGVLQLLR
ncbi:flagellin [Clostridium acetireducens DSM 10703]|uniref:Flagellin n=1 Tax=Clostridium acetireducens DSM 10703 TaxID=1121290 RepID=A0A1E8EZP3_9CLOT|nr:flagellin [Clostridium acetireducens]OFI06495.1 flagellin [Clostridium acetireducens DSM 10703]